MKTINVSNATKQRLVDVGKYGQSMDDIITELLDRCGEM